MKKAIAIIAAVIVITAAISISTTAFEAGERAAYYANGLQFGIPSTGSGTLDRFNYILTEPSASFQSVKGYGKGEPYLLGEQNSVYYILEYDGSQNIGNHLRESVLYIPYETNRNVYVQYEIITGFEAVTGIQAESVNIPHETYEGFYIASDGTSAHESYALWGNNTYPRTKGIKITASFSKYDTIQVKVTLHFTALTYSEYIKDYNNMWTDINTVINPNQIRTVGGYVYDIVSFNFVYAFFLVQAVLLVMAIAYNWMVSL